MKRRSFLKSSIIAASATPVFAATRPIMKPEEKKKTNQQYYELRAYTLKDAQQQNQVETYFQNAAIPALNRLGSKPVGVFTEQKPEGQTKLYALIPFNTLQDFAGAAEKLSKDAAYLNAGAAYLNAPATAPAYERIESSLLQAFEAMPMIETPGQQSRIFELRRYESASESAGKKKIEMFNQAGEVAIFKRVGCRPVFFGETLIGTLRPNLTYMLTFADMADHDAKWKAFGTDPEWKKISAIPEYADAKIVSHITSTFLVPTSFSQI